MFFFAIDLTNRQYIIEIYDLHDTIELYDLTIAVKNLGLPNTNKASA